MTAARTVPRCLGRRWPDVTKPGRLRDNRVRFGAGSRRAALVMLLLASPMASADDLYLDDPVLGVTIRHFDGEFVLYNPRSGDTRAARLSTIDRVVVDSVPGLEAFNRGERLLSAGDPQGAAQAYLAAQPRVRDFWKHLVDVRYLTACDRAGQLEEATVTFIRLAPMLPDKAESFRPRRLAEASTTQRAAALEHVERAVASMADQDVYCQLQLLRLDLLEGHPPEHAERVVAEMERRLRGTPASDMRRRLELEVLRLRARTGDCRATLERVGEVLESADRADLPELLLMQGRCEFELADSHDALLDAALTLMRIPVHFSDHANAAESLFLVARIHERIGRPTQATLLYQRCRALPDAGEWGQRATAALTALDGSQGR